MCLTQKEKQLMALGRHGVAFDSAETEIKLTRSDDEAYSSHVNERTIQNATQLILDHCYDEAANSHFRDIQVSNHAGCQGQPCWDA